MKVEFSKDDESIPSKYLDEGTFNCKITNVTAKDSKAGAPMVECEFTETSSGKTTRDWFMLGAGFNKFKLLGLVKATGLNASNFDTDQLRGKSVTVTRTKKGTSEYMGKVRDNYENTYSSAAASDSSNADLPF